MHKCMHSLLGPEQERSRGRLQEVLLLLSLLLAAQMPKFRFQFSYTRFSGETSCLLFAGASLGGLSTSFRNQTSVPLFLLTQKPAIHNGIPEAQVSVRPPQVQVQNTTMRPYTPSLVMRAPSPTLTVLPIHENALPPEARRRTLRP